MDDRCTKKACNCYPMTSEKAGTYARLRVLAGQFNKATGF